MLRAKLLTIFTTIFYLFGLQAQASPWVIPNTFVPNTTIQSSQMNANFQSGVNVVNALDNTNIAVGAAIAPSKMDLTQEWQFKRATGQPCVDALLAGDTFARVGFTSDGWVFWGSGSASYDVLMTRESAGVLAVRNASNSAYADIKANNLTIPATSNFICTGGNSTRLSFGGDGTRQLPTSITTSTAPSSITHGGTPATTSYSYVLTYTMPDGVTLAAPSSATTTTTGATTLSGTNTNIVSWSSVTGAVAYQLYRSASGATAGTSSATTGLLYSGTALTYTDVGNAATSAVPVGMTISGEYWHSGNWTQPGAINSNYARIHVSGTVTINNIWVVNTEMAGGMGIVGTGTNWTGGAPAVGFGAGSSGAPGLNLNSSTSGSQVGGGGGGFGGRGGTPSGGYGLTGGGTYPISSSLSGSGGGAGAANGNISGNGGAGGGSLYMEATGAIVFSAGAVVTATGGTGSASANAFGGGGGSGGGIQIRDLLTVTINSGASITAAGGPGGNGGAGGGGGGGGGVIDISGSTVTNNGTISAFGGAAGTGGATAGSTGIVNLYSFVQLTRSAP